MNDNDLHNLNRQLQDLGKELNQTTKNIFHSNNSFYTRQTLTRTVCNVVSTVKKNVVQISQQSSGPVNPPPQPSYSYQSAYQPPQPNAGMRLPVPSLAVPIILLLFGCVLLFLSLFSLLIAAVLSAGAGVLVGCLVPTIAGAALVVSSIRKIMRRSRIKKYNKAISTLSFISIKQLALACNTPQNFVLKDCRYLCRQFSSLHLDQEETCLILDRETYQFYLEAQDSQRRREEEEEKRRREAEMDPKRAQLYETLKEGNTYLKKIREVNNALPGEEISRKLTRLELVTEKIFQQVEKKPECLPDIRRFMNYYLPTTLKLVVTYQKFEQESVQGPNIVSAKQEILEALDTAGTAFENLLNKLFQDDVMDVSTDISAMETILSQEGLLDP